jgi:probable rRNA maturation factor
MSVAIEIEDEAWKALPGIEDLAQRAVAAALAAYGADAEATETIVLFTDDSSIAALNAEWRNKDYATNVLSFPVPEDLIVPEGELKPMGDIVLAYGTVAREANEQGKSLHDHTAHLIVHGVLHLLGLDHDGDEEAAEMERLEIGILKGLGISNPYKR